MVAVRTTGAIMSDGDGGEGFTQSTQWRDAELTLRASQMKKRAPFVGALLLFWLVRRGIR